MASHTTSHIFFFLLSFLCHLARAGPAKNGIIGFGISLYPDLCCQACHDSLSSLYLTCTTFDEAHGDANADMGGMVKRDDMEEMDHMAMGTTTDECRATNKPWLETMAYCIQQNCNADGYPAEKQTECFSAQAVGGASDPSFHHSLPTTAPKAELAADAVWLNTTSLVNSDMHHSVHGTLAEFVRSEKYHTRYAVTLIVLAIGSITLYGIYTQITTRLSSSKSHSFTGTLHTKLQQHILLPALFGSSSPPRRLEPLPHNLGYLPSRALTLSIALYTLLNIILSSISFRSFQPNTWFLSRGFELCEYVGNRTGTLALVNNAVAILFAGRNNLLIALTGWSQTTFLTLHRWVARVATVEVVVHSIVYTAAYFQDGYGGAEAYHAKAKDPFYVWGIVGTVAVCLAVGFACLPFRARWYEPFLVVHVVLVVLVLLATWYHLVPHFGYEFGYQVWLYICFAFWATDRLVRLGRVMVYNSVLGKGSKAVVEGVPGSDGAIMQITVFPRVGWGFGSPGQHSFVSFPGMFKGTGRFWESHPFSIAGRNIPTLGDSINSSKRRRNDISASPQTLKTDKKTGLKDIETTIIHHEASPKARVPGSVDQHKPSITFLIRAHTGITSLLRTRLTASPSQRLELSVYTEGPYAGHRLTVHPIYAADTVLCIAGGIGITHVLGFVREYVKGVAARREAGEGVVENKGRSVMKARRFILAWSAKEMALVRHVRKHFLGDLVRERESGLELLFWCTGGDQNPTKEGDNGIDRSITGNMNSGETGANVSIQYGRMDIASVLRDSVESGHRTAVMVCAPGGMADEVTRQAVRCVAGGFRVDLLEETFAW